MGFQDEAGVRAMPEDGGALGIPGEDALLIGGEEALGAQVPAYGEDAVGGCGLRGGEFQGVGAQIPIGGEVEEAQMLTRPVRARTLFWAPPKVWR